MKKGLLLAGGGVVLSIFLSACTSLNYSVNHNETDPIKFANEIRQAYAFNSAEGGLLGVALHSAMTDKTPTAPSTSYISTFRNGHIRRVTEHWEPTVPSFQSDAIVLNASFVNSQFNDICQNNGGTMVDGWCISSKETVPLFWAKAEGYTNFIASCSTCSNGRDAKKLHVIVYAPTAIKTSEWKSFVHETGWRNKKEQQQEKQFLLSGKGRGSVICRFKSHGLYPASSHVDRAYLEESNNGRLKVRIFNTTDTLDNSFTVHGKKEELVTWTSPDDWFVCK